MTDTSNNQLYPTSYCYWIAAYNAGGQSGVVPAGCDFFFNNVANLRSTGQSTNSLNWAWDAVSGATDYRVLNDCYLGLGLHSGTTWTMNQNWEWNGFGWCGNNLLNLADGTSYQISLIPERWESGSLVNSGCMSGFAGGTTDTVIPVPVTSLTCPTSSDWSDAGHNTATFLATNSPDAFECSIDSNPWVACSSPQAYPSLNSPSNPSMHSLRVRAHNSQGWGSAAQCSWWIGISPSVNSMIVEGTPRSTIVDGSNVIQSYVPNSDGTVDISWTVSDNSGGQSANSGVQYVRVLRYNNQGGFPGSPDLATETEVTVATAPASTYTWSSSFTDGSLASGIYWYSIELRDNADIDTTPSVTLAPIPVQVTLPLPPVADFSYCKLSQTATTVDIEFSDLSTNTPTSWDWDFGDGSSHSSLQNPVHTYNTGSGGQPANWWNALWLSRINVTFDMSGISENLNNVPVLVELDSTRVEYSEILPNGDDIRVIDDDGTVLDYEIEKFDSSGTTVLWVRIPSITASESEHVIWIYYNNPVAGAGEDAQNVWTNNYVNVWHLGGTGNDQVWESVSGSYREPIDSTWNWNSIDGKIGNALERQFVQNSPFRCITSDQQSLDDYTIQFWYKGIPDGNPGFQYNGLIVWATNWQSLVIGSWLPNANTPHYLDFVSFNFIGGYIQREFLTPSNIIGDHTWDMMTVVMDYQGAPPYEDETTVRVLRNGQALINQNSNFYYDNAGSDTGFLKLGTWGQLDQMHSLIDEFRISSVQRSDNWAAFQYCVMEGGCVSYSQNPAKALTLIATNVAGSDSEVKPFDPSSVQYCPGAQPPVANFSYCKLNETGTTVGIEFTDLSTSNPTSWDWDFGDGTPHSSLQNPGHTFSVSSSSAFFGDGSDGSVVINGPVNINTQTITVSRSEPDGVVSVVSDVGVNSVTVADASGFYTDDMVLLMNLQGTSGDSVNVGNYEFIPVASVVGNVITFTADIAQTYGSPASQNIILQRVPQYDDVTVTGSGVLTANGFDGSTGGVVAFFASGTLNVQSGGRIDVSARGFRGGSSSGPEGHTGRTTTGGGAGGSGSAGEPSGAGYGGDGIATGGGAGGAGGISGNDCPPNGRVNHAGGNGDSGGGDGGDAGCQNDPGIPPATPIYWNGGSGVSGSSTSPGRGGGGGGGGPSAGGAGGGAAPFNSETNDATATLSRIMLGGGSAGGAGGGGAGGCGRSGTNGGAGSGGSAVGTPGSAGSNSPQCNGPFATAGTVGGSGNAGGGMVMIIADTVNIVGTVNSNGGQGGAGGDGGDGGSGGGGGINNGAGAGGGGGADGAAGGSIYIYGDTVALGSNDVIATGGAGGSGGTGGSDGNGWNADSGSGGNGGSGSSGSVGKIAVKGTTSVTGNTNPAYNVAADPHITDTSGGSTFNVVLDATNIDGFDSETKIINPSAVQYCPGAAPPIANYSYCKLSETSSTVTVKFNDTSTNNPTSWDWDFGDESSHGTVSDLTHKYGRFMFESWPTRLRITYNTASANALQDVPVLVELTPGLIDYNDFKSGGADIRFTDSDGNTELDYEIELWNPGGTSIIWVKIPSIAASETSHSIWMYYGNSNANPGENPSGVWDDNFVGVYHLATPGAIAYDSKNGYNADVRADRPNRYPGMFGTGYSYQLNLDSYAASRAPRGVGTMEAWINRKWANDDPNDYGIAAVYWANDMWRMMWRGSTANCGRHFWTEARSADYGVAWCDGCTDHVNVYPEQGVWGYLVGTWDSSYVRTYVDGRRCGSVGGIAPWTQAPLRWRMGWHSTSSGTFDELRVSNIARSQDWIDFQHCVMTSSCTSYGSPATVTVDNQFDTSLTATNQGGFDTELKTIDLNTIQDCQFVQPPVANYTYCKLNETPINMTINFKDISTHTSTDWDWDFGDGTTDNGTQHPEHTYADTGSYDSGKIDAAMGMDPSFDECYIIFNPASCTGFNYTAVCEEPSCTYPPLPWKTLFAVRTDAIPTHWPLQGYNTTNIFGYGVLIAKFFWFERYVPQDISPGDYYVEINAFGEIGEDDEIVTISINADQNQTSGDIWDAPDWGHYSQKCVYPNKFTIVPGDKIRFSARENNGSIHYDWYRIKARIEPGDISCATGNPLVPGPLNVEYNVTLAATNAAGADSERKEINLTQVSWCTAPPQTVADFSYCMLGETVDTVTIQFTDTSTQNPTGWSWNFGDSHTSILQNPVNVFLRGTYNVNLSVTAAYSTDSVLRNIAVNDAPLCSDPSNLPPNKKILIITDGTTNTLIDGSQDQDLAVQEALTHACSSNANSAKSLGVPIFIIGIGPDLANQTHLERIAKCTNGEYFRVDSSITIQQVRDKIFNWLFAEEFPTTSIDVSADSVGEWDMSRMQVADVRWSDDMCAENLTYCIGNDPGFTYVGCSDFRTGLNAYINAQCNNVVGCTVEVPINISSPTRGNLTLYEFSIELPCCQENATCQRFDDTLEGIYGTCCHDDTYYQANNYRMYCSMGIDDTTILGTEGHCCRLGFYWNSTLNRCINATTCFDLPCPHQYNSIEYWKTGNCFIGNSSSSHIRPFEGSCCPNFRYGYPYMATPIADFRYYYDPVQIYLS